jgi:uncharacterized membrane protein YfcA
VSLYILLVALAAAAAGAVSAVAGFGIGSTLTPLLAFQFDLKLAVAAASIPHFAGNLLRFLRLRRELDLRVFWGFGMMNAAGAAAGALLHTLAAPRLLTMILGLSLVAVGIVGVSGYSERMRFGRVTAWIAGVLSGLFGALVGNQGGIRAAAMLGLGVRKEAFVATATAIALAVDFVRVPVYLMTQAPKMAAIWPVILTAAVAVLAGTLAGETILRRIPEGLFRRVVTGLIGVIGVVLIIRAL